MCKLYPNNNIDVPCRYVMNRSFLSYRARGTELRSLVLSALGILLTLLSSWDETVSYGGHQVLVILS